MAYDRKTAEANCCFGHTAGCAAHKQLLADGKPFVLQDHKEELNKAGLTSVKDELKADAKAKKKPPGKPTLKNGVPIYPVRRFA